MKRLLISIAAIAVAFVFMTGCDKSPVSSTELSIVLSDISTQTLSVAISAKGTEPSLVRMLSATPSEEVIATVESLGDKEAVKAYLTRYGAAITLPYSAVVKDLNPETEYVIGAIAFDENMDPCGFKVEVFTTKEFGSATVGDASGAGSLDKNELE